MQSEKEFNVEKLMNGVTKAEQKIIENYLDNFRGYQHDNRDIALSYLYFFTKLFAHPHELIKVWSYHLELIQSQQLIWRKIYVEANGNGENKPFISPQKGDKRFIAPEWDKYPYFNFIKQNYLLAEQLATRIIDEVELSDVRKKKLDFYTQQYLNLLSPANFLATNPEAIELAIKTKGKSLWDGFNNLLKDIEKGRITQTDEAAFDIGKNLAATPGEVVYQNELIQLIKYTPVTKSVYEIPLLIIPPWINKYYILDLQPTNSFVKFMVDQGFEVFIISWKNPTSKMGDWTFDDYVNKGALAAIEEAQKISGAKKINTLGYCLGGTLLSIASSILATRKKDVISSVTFLAAMIDFSDIGPMGDVIDEALVSKLERGELLHDTVMHGHDMERAFNLIRAKDLIWNYAVNNYLKGITPSAFDVIYWTNDNTNLPAKMYIYYMRKMIFENKLGRKNALRIADTLIDIGKIEAPVFVIGMKEDYISPPATAFITTELVSGPVEFILGGSGHVMGVANPPTKKKYGYYQNGKLGYGYEEWLKTAIYSEGSWWTLWSERLVKNSGKEIPVALKLQGEKYKSIEPAPGSYVKEKCENLIKECKEHMN